MAKEAKVSEKKIKIAKEIADLIERYNTTMISSSANLRSSQLQKIRKELRENVIITFVKKSTALRGIKKAKKEAAKELEKYVEESPVILFSDSDPFDLASVLTENRSASRAKAGQVASADIAIESGPTDLLPGPILSDLGAVGIKAGIIGGKVTIKEPKVLVKKGEKISKSCADILMKLEILPFKSGLEPIAAYDSKNNKVYTNINIDKEGTLAKLKEAFSTALRFAIDIGYPAKEVISNIIEKAEREAIALQNLISAQQPAEEKAEGKKEESAQSTESQPSSQLPESSQSQNTQGS